MSLSATGPHTLFLLYGRINPGVSDEAKSAASIRERDAFVSTLPMLDQAAADFLMCAAVCRACKAPGLMQLRRLLSSFPPLLLSLGSLQRVYHEVNIMNPQLHAV